MAFHCSPAVSRALAVSLVVSLLAPLSPLSPLDPLVPGAPWAPVAPVEAATEGFADNYRVDDSGNSATEQSRPDMAVKYKSGVVHTVWQDDRNGDFDVYYACSIDGGKTFGANIRADDGPGGTNARYPGVAVGPSGEVYVVWGDDRGGNPDIRLAKLSGSSFTASVRVDDSPGGVQDNPEVAVGLNGHVYVVWEDGRTANDDIYFSMSTDNGTSFSANLQVNDNTPASAQGKPDIAVAPDGKIVVVWEDARQMYQNNFDIYGARSANGGSSFSTDYRINTDLGDYAQRGAKVAADRGGNFYCAWYDFRNSNYDIFLANSTDGGSMFGTDAKIDDGPPGSKQTDPAIAAGRKGHVAVAWTDDANGTEDIRLAISTETGGFFKASSRVDDSTNDTDAGNDNTHQNYPAVTLNNDGTICASWTDARRGNRDIWGTVTSAGNPFENSAPALTRVRVAPELGSLDTEFAFSVNYTDKENNRPEDGYPKLRIYKDRAMTQQLPGGAKTMAEVDPADTSYHNGKEYRKSFKLAEGGVNYTFVVVAQANGGNRTLVTSAPVHGPVVDADPVSFASPVPDPDRWQLSQYSVRCNITITDTLAGVDTGPDAIQYRLKPHGHLYFGDWETFHYNTSQSSYMTHGKNCTVSQLVNFPGGEGNENTIQWRARDLVGNGGSEGYTESPYYFVAIDSYGVQFADPTPDPESPRAEDDVKVTASISLTDNGTGVDESTIFYRYSTTGALDERFSDWIQVNSSMYTSTGLAGDNSIIEARANLTLWDGSLNYVQWMAYDIAGHKSTSQKYNIKVDESLNSPPGPPTYVEPESTADRTPHLEWDPGTDPEGDPLWYDVAIGTTRTKENVLAWTSTGADRYYDVVEPLDPGKYYVKVRARDYFECSEPLVSPLQVTSSGNTGPEPPGDIAPGVTADTSPLITWSPGSDADGDELSYFISISLGEVVILDWTRTFETSFQVDGHLDYGTYLVSIRTFDGLDSSMVVTRELVIAFYNTTARFTDPDIVDDEKNQTAGTNASYSLEIGNFGTAPDDAVLELEGNILGNASLWLDPRRLSMEVNLTYPVILWVDLPDDAVPGTYNVFVNVISAGGIETSSAFLNILVEAGGDGNGSGGGGGGDGGGGGGGGISPPPGDGADGVDGAGGDGGLGEMFADYWWMFLFIFLLLGLLMAMGVLTARKSKERRREEEKRAEEAWAREKEEAAASVAAAADHSLGKPPGRSPGYGGGGGPFGPPGGAPPPGPAGAPGRYRPGVPAPDLGGGAGAVDGPSAGPGTAAVPPQRTKEGLAGAPKMPLLPPGGTAGQGSAGAPPED